MVADKLLGKTIPDCDAAWIAMRRRRGSVFTGMGDSFSRRDCIKALLVLFGLIVSEGA